VLENTFIHIQGIGAKTEQGLWRRSILSWYDFMERKEVVFSEWRDRVIRQELETSIAHLSDPAFFRERLASRDMWRLFDRFRDRAVYLDIETNGGDQGLEEITVIGIYDGLAFRHFTNGIDLPELEMAISKYALIITYNGGAFDLPRIRRWFPHIALPPAHIDLKPLLNLLGYRGGLKKIEKDLGIRRDGEIEGMHGREAVSLWKAYQWGDPAALDRLIQYNRADVLNLEPLMAFSYETMKGSLLNPCLPMA
jgi:uncharacterized protein YprB with RNaseH-like and TPR domain